MLRSVAPGWLGPATPIPTPTARGFPHSTPVLPKEGLLDSIASRDFSRHPVFDVGGGLLPQITLDTADYKAFGPSLFRVRDPYPMGWGYIVLPARTSATHIQRAEPL